MQLTRRGLLQAASSALLALTASRAAARGISDGPGLFDRTISCDNAGVPRSDAWPRFSQVGDFGGTGCKLSPDRTEGPYFVCDTLTGRDIGGGQPGAPLTVAFRAIDSGSCAPIPGAVVDIWHCNALGAYSGYAADPDEPAGGSRRQEPTLPDRYCRGALVTDADGIAEFDTIFPGFYARRPVHIHYKLHLGNRSSLTSQADLPEDVTARIMAGAPYSTPRGISRRRSGSGEKHPLMQVSARDGRMLATMVLVIDT